MKKVFIIGFFALICSGNYVVAQSNDTYKVKLTTMLESAGTEQTFAVMINQMFGMLKQQKTNVPETVWSSLQDEFRKTSLNELVEMLAPIYQKHLTEADLQKVIDFYQTPAGKKFAEKTPLITQESMQVGQQWGMQVGQRLMEKLKEKGY